jgi:hypothetical protein
MAATGLLGINPYFKGVNIDTSKPINLAIQLQQKEQAKAEASGGRHQEGRGVSLQLLRGGGGRAGRPPERGGL